MKNILILYAAQIGLSLLFVAISVLIFFFGARPGLIKHKLKVGSMLLAFNAMLAGCFNSAETNTAKENGDKSTDSNAEGTDIWCYVPPSRGDTESESVPTATDSSPDPETDTGSEEMMCYVEVPETEIGDSDSDAKSTDSASDSEIDAGDIECYDPVMEDSDSESESASDTKEWESDIECYDMPADDEDL